MFFSATVQMYGHGCLFAKTRFGDETVEQEWVLLCLKESGQDLLALLSLIPGSLVLQLFPLQEIRD